MRKKTISIISSDKDLKAKLKFKFKSKYFTSFPDFNDSLQEYVNNHKINIYIIDERDLKSSLLDLYDYCKECSPKSKLIFVVSQSSFEKLVSKNSSLREVLITKDCFENNYTNSEFFERPIHNFVDAN